MTLLGEKTKKEQMLIVAVLLFGFILIFVPIVRYVFISTEPRMHFSKILSLSIGIVFFLFGKSGSFFSTIVNAIQGWTAQIDYRKFLTGCCISFISIILMVSALEFIAWISFKKPSNQEMGHPLIQETEFVAAWEEGSQLRQQNLDLIDWETYYLMPDFEGEYVNVVNHQRVTTDQPEAYHHTIYLFGGSTMVGIEVGDSYTIPSYLQRLINDAYPNSYRVENMGVDAYSAYRQKQHLMNGVDLAPGDIVIFYDGMNDGSYAYFCCAVFEYWGTEPDPDGFSLETIFLYTVRFLERNSHFYKQFIYLQKTLPQHLWSPEERNAILDSIEERYYSDLLTAYEYSTENEALFFHFLQPNLFTSDSFSRYEETVLLSFQPGGFGRSIQLGYGALYAALDDLEKLGVHNKDLTGILDVSNRAPNTEYYFDSCHVNHLAHEVIALEIFKEISPHLEQQLGNPVETSGANQ
jgi:hypothetical protein